MMNRLFMAMSALLFLAACNTVEKDVNIPEKGETDKKEIILTATSLSDTKTVLDDNYTTVLWRPADEIKVFSAGEDSKFTSLNTEESNIAQFRGTISVITGVSEGVGYDTNIYGLYPYDADATLSNGVITTTLPSTQTAIADSFDDDLFITIGKSETLSMGFFNVCSGLRFSFSEGGFTSVILSSNNGEALAGTFSVGFDNNGKPAIQSVDSPSTNITVNAPSGGFMANTWYYVICLPGTISGGITLSATNATSTGTYTIESSLTFSRGVFKQMSGLDSKLVWNSTLNYAVDLGLSVLWATCNLCEDGFVSSPEEFGDYYAWGEIEPRYVKGHSQDTPCNDWRTIGGQTVTGYDWESYKWSNGAYNKLIRYCPNNKTDYWDGTGTPDNKIKLMTGLDGDDVASRTLGGNWRMPTDAECTELKTQCTWSWITQNGVTGRMVTGPNGNSIFLPAAGSRPGINLKDAGSYGEYWSSSLSVDIPFSAWAMYFNSDSVDWRSMSRVAGKTIRPVYAE